MHEVLHSTPQLDFLEGLPSFPGALGLGPKLSMHIKTTSWHTDYTLRPLLIVAYQTLITSPKPVPLPVPALSLRITNMGVSELVSDPALRPLLSSSQNTLAHIIEMLNWVDQNQSAEPSTDTQLTLSKYQKTMVTHLAQLRGHNRRAIFGVRATKQETAEARQEVDRLLLQLQNLYYEQRHLMGEIGACEGYEYAYRYNYSDRRGN
jgi:Fms-interacting protein/Thoc5